MIKQLYIMKFNGTLLYSKSFFKEEKIDDNILIGFFASLTNFSREALESEIEYIDLGNENKLVLVPHPKEKLLATAIVNSINDNELISKILRNILQDFIGTFAPDYDLEKIDNKEMNPIIQENLEGKISRSLINRLIITWILLIPLCIFLNFLILYSRQYILQDLYLDKEVYTQEEVYTEVMPAMVLISLFILLIGFILPNLLSGYLVLNEKLAYINSILYLIILFNIYFFTIDSLFAYLLIAYLPLVVLISIGFSYIGFRMAKKRKIIKNKSNLSL